MSRLIQIIQNTYIRLEGLFGIVFQSLANFFKSFFGFFARLLGITSSNYFLESDSVAQDTKQAVAQEQNQKVEKKTPETPISIASSRPNAKKVENYYLNMAKDVKK